MSSNSSFHSFMRVVQNCYLKYCYSVIPDVMTRLLFSSEDLTAATDTIQQLQFCCFLSLSKCLTSTYAPTRLPTDPPTHILSHTNTSAHQKGGGSGLQPPADVQNTESIRTTVTKVLPYLPFSRNQLLQSADDYYTVIFINKINVGNLI
jgi:hypothetical protein